MVPDDVEGDGDAVRVELVDHVLDIVGVAVGLLERERADRRVAAREITRELVARVEHDAVDAEFGEVRGAVADVAVARGVAGRAERVVASGEGADVELVDDELLVRGHGEVVDLPLVGGGVDDNRVVVVAGVELAGAGVGRPVRVVEEELVLRARVGVGDAADEELAVLGQRGLAPSVEGAADGAAGARRAPDLEDGAAAGDGRGALGRVGEGAEIDEMPVVGGRGAVADAVGVDVVGVGTVDEFDVVAELGVARRGDCRFPDVVGSALVDDGRGDRLGRAVGVDDVGRGQIAAVCLEADGERLVVDRAERDALEGGRVGGAVPFDVVVLRGAEREARRECGDSGGRDDRRADVHGGSSAQG